MKTIFFEDERVVVTDETWHEVVSERWWNAPQALIFFTKEQHNKLKEASVE